MKKYYINYKILWLFLFFFSLQIYSQVTRQPYLQVITPNSVVIRWQTDFSLIGEVKYGISLSNLIETKTETAQKRSEHEVLITNLLPSTKYFYTVDGSSVGSENQYFVTSPTKGSKVPLRIWVISDFGQKSSEQNQQRRETVDVWSSFNNGYYANFVLSLGDQTQDDTRYQIQHNFFNQLENVLKVSPLFTVVGNHDNHDSLVNYLRTFTLPANGEAGGIPSGVEEFYSFDFANVHVIALSTETDIGGKQKEWLKEDLENNKQDWTIACMHKPFHSGGHHNSNLSKRAQERRTNWLPTLEEYGVDLILQGHNHIYERSYLIDNLIGNTTTVTNKNKIDTAYGRMDVDNAYYKKKGLPNQGTVFIEVTAGGNAREKIEPYSIFPVYFSSKEYEGSLVIDINDNQMDVKFLCNEKNEQGSHIWDYFTIIKTE